LLGIDSDLHEVLEYECGKYHIRMHLLDKHSKMKWHLVVVYCPAQPEGKEEFITEFAQVCNKCKEPAVI
jgi:hypothetical protein